MGLMTFGILRFGHSVIAINKPIDIVEPEPVITETTPEPEPVIETTADSFLPGPQKIKYASTHHDMLICLGHRWFCLCFSNANISDSAGPGVLIDLRKRGIPHF